MCGERLREDKRPRGESSPEPIVLERVMTGEVFTAVLGKAEREKEETTEPVESGVTVQGSPATQDASVSADYSNQANDWMARASAAMELKKYAKAIEFLDRVLELSPRDPRGWYKKGVCLAMLGNHVDAIRCYEKAIEENPEDARLWFMKGKSQTETKSFVDALFSMDRSLEIRPEFTEAWHSKGGLLEVLGKIAEAYASFSETLRLNPDHAEARIRRNNAEAVLINKGLQTLIAGTTSWSDLPGSMRYDARSGPSTSRIALISQAEDAMSENRLEESLYLYDQALALDDSDSFLWREKGNILSKMGRHRRASECYQRSASLAGQAPQIPREVEREELPSTGQAESHEASPTASAPNDDIYDSELATEEAEETVQGLPQQETLTGPDTVYEETAVGTPQSDGMGEAEIGAEDVSRLERKIDEIVSSGDESPPTEAEDEEAFISSKLRVKSAKEKELLSTHVKGFDEALGGGIPKGHTVIVAGAAGTMKSSLAFSILFNQALKRGRMGLYVTLDQNTGSLIAQASSLGMEYERVRKSLRIFDMAYIKSHTSRTKEQWMNMLYTQVKKLKKKLDLDFIVIDSLDALLTLGEFESKRSRVFRLFEWLRQLDVTTFVVCERPDFVIGGNVIQSKTVEDFLADGILHLRLHLVNDVDVQRRIRCLKMREANHSTGYMALSWDDGSFNVTRVVRR
ncbi:MAG: tetratricopeptide repeat protein [Thermoplasmata archaeon]|nr:tetratricopeptide repeat protein [Thermoplasmata archaeon]